MWQYYLCVIENVLCLSSVELDGSIARLYADVWDDAVSVDESAFSMMTPFRQRLSSWQLVCALLLAQHCLALEPSPAAELQPTRPEPGQIIAGGGYSLQLQDCQRQPGIAQKVRCEVLITNQKTVAGNPIIFLKKGYTRARVNPQQQFAADYITIGQQKGYSNLIPRLSPGNATRFTLTFSQVPIGVTQFSSLAVHYREDDGGSPYVGDYFAAVFQNIAIR
jgi:hypothetical protein